MHETARWVSSAKRAVPGETSVTGFDDTGPVVDLILIGSARQEASRERRLRPLKAGNHVGAGLAPRSTRHGASGKVDVMTQQDQPARLHSSDPAEGGQQAEVAPPTAGEPRGDEPAADELRRHSELSAEGE